jgi:hypothetical protein
MVARKSKTSKTRDTGSRRNSTKQTSKKAIGKKDAATKASGHSTRPPTEAKEPKHVRLPQRSDLVEGKEKPPGVAPKTMKNLDPRTESQDPALKK